MATIEELLARLAADKLAASRAAPLPEPAAPVSLGPLSTDTSAAFAAQNPEPVPPRFVQPVAPDMDFVNQYAGAAPVAPTIRQPGFLEKLSTILLGVGSGLQGRAPQFIESVREERDRPIREYNAALERYQGRRTQGVELAERRAERESDRAQRAAEQQYEREFQAWVKKTGVRDAEAVTQMRQAFEIQKIREQERIADERLERQDKAAKDKQRNDIYAKLITQDFAPQKFANEIADAIVFGKALSPAAEKWRSVKARKLEAQLANIGGGSGGSGPVMAELQNGQTVPASLVNSQSGGVMLNGALVPVVRYTGGRIPAPAGSRTEPFPGEAGGPQGPLIPRQETLAGGIRMTAPAPTKARARAKAKLRAGGYSAAEADQELDRLGIQ